MSTQILLTLTRSKWPGGKHTTLIVIPMCTIRWHCRLLRRGRNAFMNIALHGETHCIGLRRLEIRLCTQTTLSLDVMHKCAVRKNCIHIKYYYGYKK